jgi:tetratricopeptide (TPR) repeat protein
LLQPDQPEVLMTRGRWLMAPLGRFPEAISDVRKAISLDPVNPAYWTRLGGVMQFTRNWPEMKKAAKRALEINPDAAFPPWLLAYAAFVEGRPAEALAMIEPSKVPERWRLELTAHAYHQLGKLEDEQRAIDALVAHHAHDGATQIAECQSWRGETDRAFESLERARRQREVDVIEVRFDDELESLRKDPRWLPFLRSLNLL